MRFVLVAFVVCFGMAVGEEIKRSEHWISTSSDHRSLQATSCPSSRPTACGTSCCQYSPCTATNSCPLCPSNYLTCRSASASSTSFGKCCPSDSSRCYVQLGYDTCQQICTSSETQCADGKLSWHCRLLSSLPSVLFLRLFFCF